MKRLISIGLTALMLLTLSSSVGSEDDAFQLVESRRFRFEAESLTSQRGFHRSLISAYYISIIGDSAKAYMPYVGRAYSAGYGKSGAVEFDDVMQKYTAELKKKKKEKNNQMFLKFSIKGRNETYDCSMSVTKSGFTSVRISSDSRSTCSYDGKLYPIPEKE